MKLRIASSIVWVQLSDMCYQRLGSILVVRLGSVLVDSAIDVTRDESILILLWLTLPGC